MLFLLKAMGNMGNSRLLNFLSIAIIKDMHIHQPILPCIVLSNRTLCLFFWLQCHNIIIVIQCVHFILKLLYSILVPNYHVLIELLEKVVDWKTVATHLLKDEDGSKIKGIEMTYHHDVEDCRAEMIRLYLKSGNVSWQNILSALRKSKYSNLADDIERNI